MPDKKYLITIPGQEESALWGEDRYNANKDALLKDHPDAEIAEIESYSAEDAQDNDMYLINIDGKSEPAYWNASRFNANKDALLRDYPNAQIQRVRGVDYWGEQRADLERRMEEHNNQYGAFLSDYEAKQLSERNARVGTGGKMHSMYTDYLFENAGEYSKRNKEREDLRKEYYNNPSVKKEREGDLMSVKEMSSKLEEEANARYKQAIADYQAEGGNIASRGADVTISGKAETQMYNSALNMLKKAQETLEAPSKYDESNGFVNFMKGAGHTFGSVDFWSAGLTEIQDNAKARAAFDRLKKELGTTDISKLTEEEIDNALSPAEKAMVLAFTKKALADYKRSEDMSLGYQSGKSAAESLGFMAQFLMTGAVTSAAAKGATSGMARWLAKNLGNAFVSNAAPGITKFGAKALQHMGKFALGTTRSLVDAAVRTGMTTTLGRSISEQALPNVFEGTLPEASEYILKGLGDAFIENWSEAYGGVLSKLVSTPATALFGKWGQVIAHSPMMKGLERAGFNGYLTEIGEEFFGNAMRSVLKVNPDALKEFTTVDSLIVTATSFLPMSLIGGAVSVGQYKYAGKDLENKAAELRVALQNAGLNMDEIDALVDYTQQLSPKMLSERFTPLINRLAKASGTLMNAKEVMRAASGFAKAVARYQAVEGGYQAEENNAKNEYRDQLQQQMNGEQFWTTRELNATNEQGEAYTQDEVRVATLQDGTRAFILGQEGDQIQYIDEQGNHKFLNAQDLPSQVVNDRTMSLDQFLSEDVIARRSEIERARMFEQRETQKSEIRAAHPIGSAINLGTRVEPLEGVIAQYGADYVVVQTQDATNPFRTVSYEQVGQAFNTPIRVLSDEQMASEEAAILEAQTAEREAAEAETNEEMDTADMSVESAAELEEEAAPTIIPQNEDGSVNEAKFLEDNPEAYVEWNDAERQDGGADSLEQLQMIVPVYQAQYEQAAKAWSENAANPTARREAKNAMAEWQDKINRINNLIAKYTAPAEEEARAQAQSETEQRHAEQMVMSRERINEWRRTLGLNEDQLVVFESEEDVRQSPYLTDAAKRETLKVLQNGLTPGWYNTGTNKVFLYLPHISSQQMLDKTIAHEVVTHFSLANFMGEEAYNELMDKVWNAMSDSKRFEYLNYEGVRNIKDADKRRRTAAEEYMAEVAEAINLDQATPEQKSVWQRIADFFRNLFKKKMNVEFSDKDIAEIIRGNYQQLRSNAEQGATYNDKTWRQENIEAFRAEASQRAAEQVESSEANNQTNETEAQNNDAAPEVLPDGTNMWSTKTYREGGRDYLAMWLQSDESISEEERKYILDTMDFMYNAAEGLAEKYSAFGAWSEADVVRDAKGDPIMSVIKANGDYAMNLDFSLVCKKRRALNALLNKMIKDGRFDGMVLREKEIARINQILQKHGFEVACALCFVDAKRYRVASVATQFTSMYNDLVKSLIPKGSGYEALWYNYMQEPNQSEEDARKNPETVISNLPDEALDWTRIDKILKRAEGKKQLNVEEKIAKLLKSEAKYRRLASASDFISDQGFELVTQNNPELLKLYNAKKGTGGPKASLGDVQYLNNIAKSQAFSAEKAYKVGGVRIQSFSDYMPHMFFDYMQMMAELAGKRLPAHAYTKEPAFARLFGMTGMKINLSLVPRVDMDGIAPGLDAEGNYTWAVEYVDEEGRTIATQTFPPEIAFEMQQDPRYSGNVGAIAVGISDEHILKMLGDPNIHFIIPYHKSSLNPDVAKMAKIDQYSDYTNYQTEKLDPSHPNAPKGKLTATQKKAEIAKRAFDFYGSLAQTNDPKQTAADYLVHCKEVGLIPKFPQFANNENYYKLLVDFNTYDFVTGEYAPQGAVTMTFPDNMLELIEEGLVEDQQLDDKLNAEISEVAEEVYEEMGTNMFKTRITPEQDAAYLKAVEAGDMETAQRMVIEAAKLAMPNTKVVDEEGNPKVVYHQTNAKVYINRETGQNWDDLNWKEKMEWDERDDWEDYWEEQDFNTFSRVNARTTNEFDGFFFAPKYDEYHEYGDRTIAAFVNIQNPASREDYNIDSTQNDAGRNERIRLQEAGFDGVIRFDGEEVDEYIAFEPSQIKSAEPVTYDNDGNVIPLSERFNEEKEDIRFKTANNNQAIFVSNAAKAVEGIKMEKATPEQWLKMIEKNGGLKAGEDKWMGLSDFLKSSDKKTLTKQDVLDFVNEHMIQIEEVHYDAYAEERASDAHSNIVGVLQNKFNDFVAEYHEEHGYDDEYDDPASKYAIEKLRDEMEDTFPYTIELVYGNEVYVTFDYEEEDEMVKWAEKTGVNYIPGENPINSTRLNYTTDGLENKHEIALTIPTIEPWNESDDIHFGDAGEGRAVAWIRFGETEVPTAEYKLLLDEMDRLKEVARELYEEFGGGSNELAEVEKRQEELRLEMRSYKNAGSKVLVIDEIQSKRHQEGREKGYSSDFENSAKLQELNAELEQKTARRKELKDYFDSREENELVRLAQIDMELDEVTNVRDYDRLVAERDEINKSEENALAEFDMLVNQINELEYDIRREKMSNDIKKQTAIPDAPFDKNWHELAMKRMLRYAAENGYDAIAWTKGDQQAERYDIGGVLEAIQHYESENGRVVIIKPHNNESSRFVVNNEGLIIDSKGPLSGEARTLSDVVGKELAVRIMSGEGEEIEKRDGSTYYPAKMIKGDGIRIGSEGMKGFYDRMLPAFMNKYGKKWGVKVEDIHLNLEGGLDMHSVPVTEEMKESVMEGQTMFKTRHPQEFAKQFMEGVVNDFYNTYETAAPASVVYVKNRRMVEEALGFGKGEMPDWLYERVKEEAKGSGAYLVNMQFQKEDGTEENRRRILIFAKEDYRMSADVDRIIFHENTHGWILDHPELLELGKWLAQSDDKTIQRVVGWVKDAYKEESWANEMLSDYVGRMLSIGKGQMALDLIPDEYKPLLNNIYEKFGYRPEQEDGRRVAELIRDAETLQMRDSELGEPGSNKTLFKTGISPEVRKEMDVISATAIVNGNYMKAPNGKDSKLTPEQWAMVRTKNFLNWFGDWINDPENASKVVDENGEPMVVYHGTAGVIDRFEDQQRSPGFWFTNREDVANGYAESASAEFGEEKNIIPVFLNIRNPRVEDAHAEYPAEFALKSYVENDNGVYEVFDTYEEAEAYREANVPDGWVGAAEVGDQHDLVERAIELGHDGVVMMNMYDQAAYAETGVKGTQTNYVVLDANQIKSATDNTGEFSEDEDIRFKTYAKEDLNDSNIATALSELYDDFEHMENDIYGTEELVSWIGRILGNYDGEYVSDLQDIIDTYEEDTREFGRDFNEYGGRMVDTEDRDAKVSSALSGLIATISEAETKESKKPSQTGVLSNATRKEISEKANNLLEEYIKLREETIEQYGKYYEWDAPKEVVQRIDKAWAEYSLAAMQLNYPYLYKGEEGTTMFKTRTAPAPTKTTGTPTEQVVKDGLVLSVEDFTDLAGNIFSAMPEDVRRKVVENAARTDYDLKKATLQMSASLAEKRELTDEEIELAKMVAQKVEDAVLASGVEMTRPFTTNEALWMLYQSTNPTGEYDLIGNARKAVVANNLGMSQSQQEAENRTSEEVMFKRVYVPEQAVSAADAYMQAITYFGNRLNEAFVDQFDSVDQMMKAIEDATGKKAESWEDIRIILNQSASKGLAKLKEVERELIQKMWDAVNELAKTGVSHERISRHVILKHGLERNEVFAARDARQDYEAEYRDEIRRIKNDTTLTAAQKNQQMADAKKVLDDHLLDIDNKVDAKYLENRKTDYSGIKAMFADYPGLMSEDNYSTAEEYRTARRKSRVLKYRKLSDAEMQAEMECDAFEVGRDSLIKGLWSSINNLTQGTLKMQHEYGMLSNDAYKSLTGMFKYYVPLRGFADNTGEDLYDYYGHNVSDGYAPAIIGAKGRKSEAESPFGWMAAMAATAVVSGEKNLAKQALYYFTMNRKANDLLKVADVWYVESPTDPGKFYPEYPPKADPNKTPAENAQQYADWEEQMEDMARQGKAVKKANRLDVAEIVNFGKRDVPEHIIKVNINGEEKQLILNANPRAAQAINGLLNIESNPDYQKVLGKVLRWMSQVSTGWNPEFWMTNISRDTITAFASIGIKEDKDYNEAFRRNWADAWKIVKLLPKLKDGSLGSGRLEDLLREAVENGVQTGYSHIKSMEEWDSDMEKYISDLNKDEKKVVRGTKNFLDRVQTFSEAMELVSRFATYLTSREMGRDVAQSVADAKEVTVNFNRKGSGMRITLEEAKKLKWADGTPIFSEKWKGFKRFKGLMSIAYVSGISAMAPFGRKYMMFFNAAIQGLNMWIQLGRQGHGKQIATLAGTAFALGMLNSVVAGMLDGDDDDYQQSISDYERRTNLMLGANGFYLKVALPQEIRCFYGLGDILYNYMAGNYHHKDKPMKIVKTIGNQLMDILPINPLGGWAEFIPSMAKGVTEAGLAIPFFGEVIKGTNMNFAGIPIRDEKPWLSEDERKSLPKYTFAGEGTWNWLVSVAELANRISGGTEYDAGKVQLDPARLQHYIEQGTGGVGRFIGNVASTIEAIANPEKEVEVSQIPFLNKLLTVADERGQNKLTNQQYYYYKGVAERSEMRYDKYLKANDKEHAKKERSSDDFKIMKIYFKYEARQDAYKERLKRARTTEEEKEIKAMRDANRKEFLNELAENRLR